MKSILRAADAVARTGAPLLLATVVRVRGSAYRRPGARMVMNDERWVAGSVSGGCLEGDVVKKAAWRTRDGAPALVTYDSTAHDDVTWGMGLGCDGVVDVLLERLPSESTLDPLAFFRRCIESQSRGALATVISGDGGESAPLGARVARAEGGEVLCRGVGGLLAAKMGEDCAKVLTSGVTTIASYETARGTVEALIEAVRPPPRLYLFGTAHDAVPVATLARALSWDVSICDTQKRFATRERFAMADDICTASLDAVRARIDGSHLPVAVVMNHSYERDKAALAMLLASRALYIGALGPRRRTARILGEVGALERLDDPRLHAPVGLELGAETPEEIALAILSEIQSTLAHAPAVSLRARTTPIHAIAS